MLGQCPKNGNLMIALIPLLLIKGTLLQNLLSECNKVYPVDFNFKAMQLLNKAVDLYTDLAKQYDQLVFHKVKKELIQQLLANLFPGFDS